MVKPEGLRLDVEGQKQILDYGGYNNDVRFEKLEVTDCALEVSSWILSAKCWRKENKDK